MFRRDFDLPSSPERARIVLLAAGGMQDKQIAAKLRIMPEKAARWRNRFLDGGLAALDKDAPRPGRPSTITPAKIQEVVRKTTQEKPSNAKQKWLARHPRFHVYFTPTSSSGLNMVERFFRDLTEQKLRRGIFRDVEELIMAIGDYIDKHNDNPKPFVWTAKASDVLEKVKRARAVLDNR